MGQDTGNGYLHSQVTLSVAKGTHDLLQLALQALVRGECLLQAGLLSGQFVVFGGLICLQPLQQLVLVVFKGHLRSLELAQIRMHILHQYLDFAALVLKGVSLGNHNP